ncbi:hypothetical protein M1L60_19740 [Actinoplanes sp. TRM 88003]|uniref:Uncharacterized protein n=1 Tax=Paractinoplanes aksuensis TaxID=2939490 RepID=A0ABT1DPR2_9ACTN|nr:hypothetical protein [Actinoplanes aksuensis]MCO8272832.1 hypothetical protein [Actinoplanes aksuensis]
MRIRAVLARLLTGDAIPAAGSSSRAATRDHVEPRTVWRPTARSAYGRYIQATEHRQAAIEAIHQRGREQGIDPKEVLAAMDHLDHVLRTRGWHPEQFDHGFDDEARIDDHVTGVDVDYDPRMAAYDAQRRDATQQSRQRIQEDTP